jgi:hypothetical protein
VRLVGSHIQQLELHDNDGEKYYEGEDDGNVTHPTQSWDFAHVFAIPLVGPEACNYGEEAEDYDDDIA